MWITIAILIISAALFANGKVRSDIVALCALCALLVFQILTPAEALSGFSNSVVIMMVGLFVVGISTVLTHWGRLPSFVLTAIYSSLIMIPLYSLVYKIGLIGGNTWKE